MDGLNKLWTVLSIAVHICIALGSLIAAAAIFAEIIKNKGTKQNRDKIIMCAGITAFGVLEIIAAVFGWSMFYFGLIVFFLPTLLFFILGAVLIVNGISAKKKRFLIVIGGVILIIIGAVLIPTEIGYLIKSGGYK